MSVIRKTNIVYKDHILKAEISIVIIFLMIVYDWRFWIAEKLLVSFVCAKNVWGMIMSKNAVKMIYLEFDTTYRYKFCFIIINLKKWSTKILKITLFHVK